MADAKTLKVGGRYNWRNQPERLIYVGLCEPRNGRWHQFEKVSEPGIVWCEVQLDAQRYRWLRDKSDPGICAFYLSVGQAFAHIKFAQETVDAAIDDQIARDRGAGVPSGEVGNG